MDPNAKTRVSESRPDPLVGRTFDGYRVESIIGRGGMGTVYQATQLRLDRAVALKVLTQDLVEDPQFAVRFHREADALSRLSHPNIVTVFDRGEVDGRPYLVMEYVEGTSLRDIVRRGPLPPAEALRIVSSVLEALAHAHERGVVHRDIKPENVLLARGGVVKVADFGLSRLLGPQEDTRLTRTHLVLGTYEYMAPEQRELAREADARSDLYATGVVLYEMLVGELPIGRFDLPSTRRPTECDGRVDRVIERSLEKNPDHRFQEATEMAGAVSAILERPQPQGPPPAARRAGTLPEDARYRPTRFEYHLDNVATIDHVLGTVAYIVGMLSLFDAFHWADMPVHVPFWAYFIVGWYLRETAEELRKHKRRARTSQAVVAILVAFTGILIPFSIYSLWTLFGHRGRTYFEARSRGLDPVDAARYTQRVLEEPFPAPAPAAPPSAARPPTPSQIPVQSMVTSRLDDAAPPAPAPRRRRTSGFVRAGMLLLGCTVAAAIAAQTGELGVSVRVLMLAGAAALGLLVIGFFHSLATPGVRGAFAAFVVFLVGGALALHWTTSPVAPQPAFDVSYPLGRYASAPPDGFERGFFRDDRRQRWLREMVPTSVDFSGLRLERQGKQLVLHVTSRGVGSRDEALPVAVAVQAAVESAWNQGRFEPATLSSDLPPGFRSRIDESPPPR